MQDFLEKWLIDLAVFGRISDGCPREEFYRAARGNLQIFLNPESWKAFLKKFNFALGPRVHGSIAAINAGLPAVCTNTDSRAAEMCAFLKIPRLADGPHADYRHPVPDAREFGAFLRRAYDACDAEAMNAAYPALFENYKNFITSQNLPFRCGECANAGMLSEARVRGRIELLARRIAFKARRSAAKRLLKRNIS